MSYSNLYFKSEKKQGVLLFIVALFSIVGFIGFIYGGGLPTTSKAGGSKLSEMPRIVNLRTTQVGIFWKTESPEIGWVMYGKDKGNINKISYDERDTESVQKSYLYHYIFLIDLSENQKYYYKIYSKNGGKIIFYSDGENNPFYFVTPKNISLKQTIKPAYGRILQQNNLPAADTFVIFNFDNYYSLLTITKLSGEFMIPLNSFVDRTTNSITIPKNDLKVEAQIFNNQQKTKVVTTLSQTNPFFQSIVLGKDYDFIEKSDVLGVNLAKQGEAPSSEISILFPKEDAVVAGKKPLIKGTALPGKTVFIHINSMPSYSFRSIADTNGEWKALPQSPIENGSYILTMTTVDKQEKEITQKRRFSIAKSGEQVLGEATIEPNLITAVPTVAPTLVTDQFFTPTSAPPNTGLNTNFLVIVSSFLVILGVGILLVF